MAEGKTILVVDDDQELIDGLRMVLERQGYRVITARDGQQGKQQVYHHRPDLMILDMMISCLCLADRACCSSLLWQK